MEIEENYYLGIDVGSTTAKIAVFSNDSLIFSKYVRHYSRQRETIFSLLNEVKEKIGDKRIRVCLTGSGSKTLADKLNVPFTQEVVANSIALKREYSSLGTAIELGGQDAKVIFFKKDNFGEIKVFDMRMNGSCAGGTGAFLDEIALVLGLKEGEINSLAEKGSTTYDISGRCGVFAKTDIQPLLNQGAKKEDIALSSFHAIAKQTIGGLAQGLDILPPVVFEGGPFKFNPKLIDVFKERLNLKDEDVLIPSHSELIMAFGAAFSLFQLHKDSKSILLSDLLDNLSKIKNEKSLKKGELYFKDEAERREFLLSHPKKEIKKYEPKEGENINAYLGIDAGSTTTKFVLIDEKEEIIDYFYSSNEGEPLLIAKNALIKLYEKYKNCNLNIISSSTTGYGELLFKKAFKCESNLVETVAHTLASSKLVSSPSFILDIGGQDMKAIWLSNNIITNIVVNEACSSGCGSFLENFAKSLGISIEDIASFAFSSSSPALLGSRCTVFMNSSIITEQREGKSKEDIMAGLCRSIIENVFTKVIRISNLSSLGDNILVQGGTFENDAVLRAMEQYLGKKVTRAPYARLMGAYGAAINAKEVSKREDFKKSFITYDELKKFSYKNEVNSICPFCINNCKRTIVSFNNGEHFVTNNRCEKGQIVFSPSSREGREKLLELSNKKEERVNLLEEREKLLFKDYYPKKVLSKRNIKVGLPRVLENYESMPFWKALFESLGFDVVLSPLSNRKIYEEGLNAVPSDTECFPAKLVHGHLRELVKQKVDYIFFPSISTFPSDNKAETSFSRCALVKGYPIVINNSDNPQKYSNCKLLAPYFFFYCFKDREKQLCDFFLKEFNIARKFSKKAIAEAHKIQLSFQQALKNRGREVLNKLEKENKYGIVITGRPYHNDSLVNHEIASYFINEGMDVLTVDSLPELEKEDLSQSILDITNNYHARVISASTYVSRNKNLELVQLVSFGCGHDAVLSDECVRIMGKMSGKSPLILKLDESDNQGPIRIRVRSFIETINRKRSLEKNNKVEELDIPYKVKFTKKSRKEMTVLVPNASHAFSRMMASAIRVQKIKSISTNPGHEEAIKLGKKFTHNDVCFPAQIVIGELIEELLTNKYEPGKVAVFMAKYVCCCRLTHYAALLRKALDDAGFSYVPIITNDDVDFHQIHPGYKMTLFTTLKLALALPVVDQLEELLRKIRPYELKKGQSDEVFDRAISILCKGVESRGIIRQILSLHKAIDLFKEVEYDRSIRKERVLIVGEYLLNFHPGANNEIERYLENNNFEVIEARMFDVLQKSYFCQSQQFKELHVKRPFKVMMNQLIINRAFTIFTNFSKRLTKRNKLLDDDIGIEYVANESNHIINKKFDTGEGILIPAEIVHHAKKGCNNFVILQPFGCLPNHIIGRGVAKKIKEMYPNVELLALDYDPDLSFANIENRLQMLVTNSRSKFNENKN